MVHSQPHYPENITQAIQDLQHYVCNQSTQQTTESPDKQIANLHLQLAQLAALNIPTANQGTIASTDAYAQQIAHILIGVIQLANTEPHLVSLAETIKTHEQQPSNKQPEHAEEQLQTSPQPEKPRLYGKAGMAAAGDWYGSH